jgi:hypothetical protein
MIAPDLPVALNLYSQIAPGELFRLLQRNLGFTTRSGLYSPRVLIWMMMRQRLDARGTLAKAVQELAAGELDPLLSRCKRAKEHRVSVATGGYCQARQNLPKELWERSLQEILQRLRNPLDEHLTGFDKPVYILDGSSLQLQHSPELRKAFPPTRNQQGESHGPMLRIVVLQDAETGMPEQPCWGPM